MGDCIRLVVLNFNGGEHVLRCVQALTNLEGPAPIEIVVVDNASSDGSPDAILERFPEVELVRLAHNGGFPANNVALRDLEGVRYVGLVNDDAFPAPGFLQPLVDALDADPELGAACPLMVFDHRFVDVTIEAPALPAGRGDPRRLGVLVSGVRVGGEDRWASAQLAEGGYGPEIGPRGRAEWTGPSAVLRVPLAPGEAVPATVELRLAAPEAKAATCRSGSGQSRVEVGPRPAWHAVALAGEPYDVVNNAGSVVLADGYGADRGWGEPVGEQVAHPAEVFAWCGGAVLLRPEYLRDVGLFEERLFLYYEDTDLSWRGQARGWRYRYVPGPPVRHLHAATSVAGSARFHWYTERNRLLLLVRNAPGPFATRALSDYLARTYDALRRDVLTAVFRRRRPNPVPTLRRLRAFAGLVAALPWALRARRRLRARQLIPDEVLMARLSGDASAGGS